MVSSPGPRVSSRDPLHLKVLKVSQPIGEFFVASIPARVLVEISYADVRRLVDAQRDIEKYLGIQRPVSPSRIKKIKQYIVSPDATFPTAVILAVDEKCASFDENTGMLTLEEYVPDSADSEDEPIPLNKIAKVLDGQHRIAGFIDDEGERLFNFDEGPFDINVSIFVGADISEQANIFATVNLAQTKVSRSLVYDLTELAKTRSPYKTCHNIAVALDTLEASPLRKRIKRLGVKTPGRRHETLTQASFVEALVRFISRDPVDDRNKLLEGRTLKPASPEELRKCPFRGMFIKEQDDDIAEILINYFLAVRRKWPESWDAVGETGNLLPRSNAFKALMRFLKDDVYLDIVGDDIGAIPTVEEFYSFFKAIEFEDQDFTTRNFAPGSGGQSTFLKMLRREISIEDMVE